MSNYSNKRIEPMTSSASVVCCNPASVARCSSRLILTVRFVMIPPKDTLPTDVEQWKDVQVSLPRLRETGIDPVPDPRIKARLVSRQIRRTMPTLVSQISAKPHRILSEPLSTRRI